MLKHYFTYSQITKILENVTGQTLGTVDKKNVFLKTLTNKKITGIAGDVIEQSVLGYPANNSQDPDLIIDNINTELKTTGLRRIKKNRGSLEAKEPMSITAVSPEKIIHEEFSTSSFWHKLAHLLIVYYLYDSDTTVTASEYADFVIQGFQFVNLSTEDKQILQNDWLLVQNFIKKAQLSNSPEEEYKKLSSSLRKELMLIDTAPKWPKRPRFRLKRSFVSYIAQKKFDSSFNPLVSQIKSYAEIDDVLHVLTSKYGGKTIKEISSELGIYIDPTKKINKNIGEQILVRMFNGKGKVLKNIDLFSKLELIPKTIVQTANHKGTEDTKFGKVNFDDWLDPSKSFEQSEIYEYFINQSILFMVFIKETQKTPLEEAKFCGFKRCVFDETFIQNEVKRVWQSVRQIVNNKQLVDVVSLNKDGMPIRNSNNVVKSAPNWPKSKDFTIFFRGTSADSTRKPLTINGIQMYPQYFWVKRNAILKLLDKENFI